MINNSRRSYGRKVILQFAVIGKTGHMIGTCYKNHDCQAQFKFKNQKVDSINNEQNHEGSKLEVHPQ